MRCVLCDSEGHVRASTYGEGIAVSVMCAAHEVACLLAVVDGDYRSLAEQISVAEMTGDEIDPLSAAKVLAVTRTMAIGQSDSGLLAELFEVLSALPPGTDDTDVEWAAVETIRRRYQ
jgi:hypothetical protein